jgi:uncharacterized protein YndB with AHSA1/START domain
MKPFPFLEPQVSMSVRKEPSGRRSVQVEVEVPGTPEEVWAAIATGPGVSSWFVPTEMREDGAVVSHFGPGMDAVAKETLWEPPHRFAAEAELGPGKPTMATEWTVEARDGGKCIVRVVHSLFASTDDWDDQLENIEGGWPDYFHILQLYLEHFRGMPCAGIQLLAIAAPPAISAWNKITGSLGLSDAAVGERRVSPAEGLLLAGRVERAGSTGHANQLLLRLDSPTSGLVHLFAADMGGQAVASIRFYLYGDEARQIVERDEPRWQSWLEGLFPTENSSALNC